MEKPKFSGAEFLDKKYQDLAGSKPVERAVIKSRKEGEIPHSRGERVESYVKRLEQIWNKKNEKEQPEGANRLKRLILEDYCTTLDEIPESYWKLQETIMRERGQLADWERASEEEKRKAKEINAEGVLSDQKSSLEQWLDYFSGQDSSYVPTELKYWILRSLRGLSEYDKQKSEFPKRSKGTVKMFPDLNYEALEFVVSAMKDKYAGKKIEWEHDIQLDERAQFESALNKEDFGLMYGWAYEMWNPIPEHLLPVTDGKWVKYDQGSDPHILSSSIKGKGTGWCTAGEQTAKTQLENGDFYVYYSNNDTGEPKIPRLAIRMEGDKIAEVRGVAFKQNVDPYMNDVLMTKLDDFPDKTEYIKKDADMKMLTEIDKKQNSGTPLTKPELEFLYEMNTPIESFGYQRDPRIQEIQNKRNRFEDAQTIFECSREQIATNQTEITPNTKVYIGPLFKNIFKQLPKNIEYVYTEFPNERVYIKEITIPKEYKTPEQRKQELETLGFKTNQRSEDILKGADLREGLGQAYRIVIPSNKSLGFPGSATRQQSQDKAKELGIASTLLPAIIGVELRRQYPNQPQGEWIAIDMQTVLGRYGLPRVFNVSANSVERWLDAYYGKADYGWSSDDRWAFLAS